MSAKCVSVSRGAKRAGGTPFDPAAGSISGLARATKTGGETRRSVGCDTYEVTSVVDFGRVCGGHRDCRAMAGVAEVVGGGGSLGNFAWRDSGGRFFMLAILRRGCLGLRAAGMERDGRIGF